MTSLVKHITEHPKVRQAGDITEDLFVILASLYLSAGQKVPEAQALKVIAGIFEKDIRENFASLTLAEITHAVNQGLRESDVPHISNVNLYKWVKNYMNHPDRLYALQKAKQLALPPKSKPTDQEILVLNIKVLTLCFDNYKKYGHLQDFGNACYDFLDQQGILNYTPEKKRTFFQAAKVSLAREAETRSLVKGTLEAMREASKLIEELAKHEENHKGRIIGEAKRLALKEYFNNLIEMDQHISEFFEPNN